jgi:hypothetical protein
VQFFHNNGPTASICNLSVHLCQNNNNNNNFNNNNNNFNNNNNNFNNFNNFNLKNNL